MYIYEVGYYSHEDSSYFNLQSKLNYTQEEFNEIVSNCYVYAYHQYKNSEEYQFSIEYNEFNEEDIRFDELLPLVVDILTSNFGFVVIKPKVRFNVFGWCSVNKDNFEDDSNINNELVKNKLKF